MPRAFVSHSTSDDSYVAEMESFLRALGYEDVFNDSNAIRPDEKIWPTIESGIAKCDTLVVVITSASMSSGWVKREVEYARGLSKNIIPVWIEDCPIPPAFEGHDIIDFRRRTRTERRFEISRIIKYAPVELIGREAETKRLCDAWEQVVRSERTRPRVLTFVALGGEGKTSLVAKWASEMAFQDWPFCEAAFAWSFYSQGTRDQATASSDLFLKEAIAFFGDEKDKEFAASPAGAFEKGQRLARVVGQRRSLLILDGLEPLQCAPTSPTAGELKDQGLAALLKSLAATSQGLCVVTTRYAIPDLRAFLGKTVREEKLTRLSGEAGVALLRNLGVRGTAAEYARLVEDVRGHPLTLNLLGSYLRDAHAGDIRKRDLVKLAEADAEEQGGRAFRVMDAYVKWLEREEGELRARGPGLQAVGPVPSPGGGRRALAMLSLLGLFDRPATADCLGALWTGEAIAGLTEPLVGLSEAQRNLTLHHLEDAKLLTVQRDASGALVSLDAHPLIREYFSKKLREQETASSASSLQPSAFRLAHRRLYEHLCASTHEGDTPTLEALQPLYQAVAHGCEGGLQAKAFDEVFLQRIERGGEHYAAKKLGAIGEDLCALASFFDECWMSPSPGLPFWQQMVLLNGAGMFLRSVGRLTEGLEPLSRAVAISAIAGSSSATSTCSKSLSELHLLMGSHNQAVDAAKRAVTYAEQSTDLGAQIGARSALATALHSLGNRGEAFKLFGEAEKLQAQLTPEYPILYSVYAFNASDLMLCPCERFAWNVMTDSPVPDTSKLLELLNKVPQAYEPIMKIRKGVAPSSESILDVALDQLTLGRSALYKSILERGRESTHHQHPNESAAPDADEPKGDMSALLQTARREIDAAVTGLRRAANIEFVASGLLTCAWCSCAQAVLLRRQGHEAEAGRFFIAAQSDLDEAWEIAERGPMRLFVADTHFYRARLFFREAAYPWASAAADLAAAEKLINDCGYHRRDEELADAKRAILKTSEKEKEKGVNPGSTQNGA
jgi:hypothetical protein